MEERALDITPKGRTVLPSRPRLHLAVLAVLAATACGSQPPPSVATTPAASGSASASSSSPPPAPTPEPTAPAVVDVPMPSGPCLIDARPTTGLGSTLSFRGLVLGSVPVATFGGVGTIERVRLSFAEGRPESAGVAVDATLVSLRGSLPLSTRRSERLRLYPRFAAVRAGWLSYREVVVASVHDVEIEPLTELPAWLVPAVDFTKNPFYVACSGLTPFGAPSGTATDGAISGKGVALEDDAGKTVATLDASQGDLPVAMGKLVKQRRKVSFDVGTFATAQGWVASRHVKKTSGAGVGYGTGTGRTRPPATLSCDAEVPIHVRVAETTYAFGVVHANQVIRGDVADDGSFKLTSIAAGGVEPFVPPDRLRDCKITPR